MRATILDLDGLPDVAPDCIRVPLRHWGPAVRLACSFGRFRKFQQELVGMIGQAGLVCCGSGDFHHVSLALISRLKAPCNLLVLDNHPDWMRGVPFLHCGTWLHHAARLPQVQRIFHVGGDVDFDNHYRWLAPWRLLRSAKIVVFPAIRSYNRGPWSGIPSPCLRQGGAIGRFHLETLLRPYRRELACCPLYVSVDKDVLAADDAVVNWDSGHLRLDEMMMVLESFTHLTGGLAGMDTVGDWSPVQVKGTLRRFMHWTEHPRLDVDPIEASRRNALVNQSLLNIAASAAKTGRIAS